MSEATVFENIQGVVWDLDGTLIESEAVFTKCVQEIVAVTGHPMPSAQTIKKNYHASIYDSFTNILGLKNQEELDQVMDIFEKVQEPHYEGQTDHHFHEDALSLVHQIALQGIHQAIVTNRNHENGISASPRSIIAGSKVAEFFPVIHCGDEVQERKPHPASFKNWHVDLGIKPESILVIGDQPVDAWLAHSIGARALVIARDGEHHQDFPDSENVFIVPDLHNIVINS